jgi:hypothetical protein
MNIDDLKLSPDPSKNDLLKCVVQLSERALELGYPHLSANLLTLAGASGDPTDEEQLSGLMYMYAQLKLAEMDQEHEKDEEAN